MADGFAVKDGDSLARTLVSKELTSGNQFLIKGVHDYSTFLTGLGRHFFFSQVFALGAETKEFLVTFPNGVAFKRYVTFIVEGTKEGTVLVLENPTASAGGSLGSPLNRNRQSAVSSSVTLNDVSGVATGGTSMCHRIFGSGKSGGSAKNEEPIVPLEDTNYVIRIESVEPSNTISLCLDWWQDVLNLF